MTEPVDMDDRELLRGAKEWNAELDRVRDELELCPRDHPIRPLVEQAEEVTILVHHAFWAEVKRRTELYEAVVDAIGGEV